MEEIGIGCLIDLTEPEFSGSRPTRVAGLYQYRGVWQCSLFQFNLHFGVAARICHDLGIERHRTRTLKAKGKTRPGHYRSSVGHAQAHDEATVAVDRLGVYPLQLEFLHRGQYFRRISAVENALQP